MAEQQINFVDCLVGNFYVPQARNTKNGKKVVLNLVLLSEDGERRTVTFWPGETRDSKEPMLGNGLSVLIGALARKELWAKLPEAMKTADEAAIDAVHTELLKLTAKVAEPFVRGDEEAAKKEAEYLNERLRGKIVRVDFMFEGTYTDERSGETRNRYSIPGSGKHHCPVAPSPREGDDTFAGEQVSELLEKLSQGGNVLSAEQHATQDNAILAALGIGSTPAPTAKAAAPAAKGGKPATSPAPF